MASSKKVSLRGRSSRFFHLGDKPDDITPDGVHIYHLPEVPEVENSSDKAVELQIGSDYSIPPKTYGLRFGFSWDCDEGLDLDASAALFNSYKAVMDYVWWDRPKTPEESVKFTSKDDLTGADSIDNEVIAVELDHIPNEVSYVVLAVSMYSKGKTLKDGVRSLTLRGFDSESGDKELFTYKIDSGLRGTSTLMGVLVRQGAWFKFVPLKQHLLARTITEITHEPGNLGSAFLVKAIPLERRVLKLSIKKGRNLTPMDISLFKKRSDPYLKVFYRGKYFQSEVVKATLSPTYNMEPLDIGEVVECDDDIIDVQVWDWDKVTEDDFMGMIRICVGGVCQKGAGSHVEWLPLTGTLEQKADKVKITGELLFEYTMVNLEDFDPRAEETARAAAEAEAARAKKKDVASMMAKSWRHA